MTSQLIGARIRALREQHGLTQDQLSDRFGFKDRQTLSAIENGDRRVSAEELIVAVETFGEPLDFFIDPFLLVGEGRFSWRQTGVPAQGLTAYERSAGRWIAAYRTVSRQIGREAPLFRRALGLAKNSSFESAMEAGERFVAESDLGDVPSLRLAEIMAERLGILVLYVDAIDGISGAACRLPELDAVLINRHESAGRRNFDLAHELFHILTWDAMPPEHLEDAGEFSKNRVEQLANNFAGAVLMPAKVLEKYGDWKTIHVPELPVRLNATANELRVTASALMWRLVALKWIDAGIAKRISAAAIRNNGRETAETEVPPLFSRPFMETIGLGIDQGHLSARRAASLLDTSVEELGELFTAHGVQSPVDL